MCAMVAGTAAVIALGRRPTPAAPPVREKAPETPWLSHEADAQIIGDGGEPGPLFAGLPLGGPAPLPEMRARIDAFAKANHVDIDLDVRDGELVAIRFGVTYHGCCGYEGADMLALRVRRPSYGGGCTGPWPPEWINDWAFANGDGIHVRAKVRVNRLEVRWERTESLAELLEHADRLLGQQTQKVRETEKHRFAELIPHERYVVEAPMPSPAWPDRIGHDDLGIVLEAHAGRITEVTLEIDRVDIEELDRAMRARWGRPHVADDEDPIWRLADRTVTISSGRITITSSG